jgi:hypothetical protein
MCQQLTGLMMGVATCYASNLGGWWHHVRPPVLVFSSPPLVSFVCTPLARVVSLRQRAWFSVLWCLTCPLDRPARGEGSWRSTYPYCPNRFSHSIGTRVQIGHFSPVYGLSSESPQNPRTADFFGCDQVSMLLSVMLVI